ncbi:hypothetical protein CHU98_g9306 [Xylaria longipes]|nr:hypothetical protein CHU98_g9306 [Xylaria longipes]
MSHSPSPSKVMPRKRNCLTKKSKIRRIIKVAERTLDDDLPTKPTKFARQLVSVANEKLDQPESTSCRLWDNVWAECQQRKLEAKDARESGAITKDQYVPKLSEFGEKRIKDARRHADGLGGLRILANGPEAFGLYVGVPGVTDDWLRLG